MKTAVFPGSFDPVTLGHLDIIERASKLFDRVVVSIAPNGEKAHPMFTDEQKLALMKASIATLPNVEAEICKGLLTEHAEKCGAQFIVRGCRSGSNFDEEYALSLIYHNVSGNKLDTVLLCAEPTHQHLSSTMVREMIKYQRELEKYMPLPAAKLVKGWEENGKQ